jgi:glutaredoxin
MWRRIWSWLRTRPPRREPLHVTLYTRDGCHLCDDALKILQREQRRHHFELEVVDVDRSPELVAEHGESVPVVVIDGKVRFRGIVNVVLLRRLLDR